MAPYFSFNVPCAITTTTTTTTTTAPPCYCFGVIPDNGNTDVQYSRCSDGSLITVTVTSAGGTRYFCSRATPVWVGGAEPFIFQCNSPATCNSDNGTVACGGCS